MSGKWHVFFPGHENTVGCHGTREHATRADAIDHLSYVVTNKGTIDFNRR